MWQCLRLCIGIVIFLLFNGCALANPQRVLVADEAAKDKPQWSRHEILQQRDAYFHALLSYAYQLRSQIPQHLAKAVQELEQAVRSQPDVAFLYAELARLQLRRGELQPALEAAQAALEREPDSHPAYRLVGKAHARLQQYDEAQAALEKAIELQPDDADAYLDLSALHAKAGRPQAAVAVLEALLTRRPDSLRGLFCARAFAR